MGRKILFSPVGGNDPVSSKTEHDGSMLHICRWYKPDEVYLYLSKEMVERHKADNRYVYCIEKLGELLEWKFDVHVIENPMLEEVQDYDIYYDEFRKYIAEIEDKMESDDILYVNIASGTPAMKSALLMMAIMSEKNIKAVQVTTPEKSIQEHSGKDKDYDPEYYWEINKDNDEDNNIDRCSEPKCPNLVDILKKNIIIRHLRAYDYSAAFMLGKEIRSSLTKEAYDLLDMAYARSQLDLERAAEISKKYKYKLFPIKKEKEKSLKTFEYILTLKLKIHRDQLADFMRAISPLLTDLFETILNVHCEIDINKYCKVNKGIKKWDVYLLQQSREGKDILDALNNEFYGNFKSGTAVSTSNLKPVLLEFLEEDDLKETVKEMRDIEEKVRNIAAHQMVSVTRKNLNKLLGKPVTIEKIFENIMILADACKMAKKDSTSWNSYDKMNEYIISKINS